MARFTELPSIKSRSGAGVSLTPIVPKGKIDDKRVRDAVKLAGRRINKIVKSEFEKTTKTWKRKPTFKETIDQNNNQTSAKVETDNIIYFYINFGTRYILVRFTPDFETKTLPGWLNSRPGHPRAIYDGRQHPGIIPREWDLAIVEKHGKRFGSILSEEIDNAVRASGLGI